MPVCEFWRWEITDPITGKRSKTRHRMREADALVTDRTATRVAGTLELRDLVDQPRSQSTGDYTPSATDHAKTETPSGRDSHG